METLNKRINIVHVVPDIGIGGLSKVVVDISRNIDKNKYNVSVYAIRKCEEEFTQYLIKAGINVTHGQEMNQKYGYAAFVDIGNYLRRVKADIVHTHNTGAFIDGTMGAIIARVPIRIHTDHARLYPDKRRYLLAEKILSYFVKKIVAVSEHTKNDLMKYQKISENKILVIPNGIDLGETENIDKENKKRELGISNGAHIIGLGVRLEEQKGIKYLIRAMPCILKNVPGTVCLVAGEGSKRKDLENEALKLGISDSVIFIGVRRDMMEIVQVMDVYVLPSIWEGLPLVILEAMAMKKPIVATAVGGTPTAIKDGETGKLVVPENEAALSEAIIMLLRDKKRARQLGENAYKYYNEKFTVKKMLEGYESLYGINI